MVNPFRPKLFLAATQSQWHQLIHGLLYIYYEVKYAVWFLAFTNTITLLISNQDTAKGAMNVMVLEHCNGSLVSNVVVLDKYLNSTVR